MHPTFQVWHSSLSRLGYVLNKLFAYVVDTSKSRATNKKKKKGKAAAEPIEDDSKSGGLGLDGRAGPRSENVVLQKSAYICSRLSISLHFVHVSFFLSFPFISAYNDFLHSSFPHF